VLQKLNFAISCASEDIYEILGAVLSFLRDSQLSNRDETNTKHNQKSSLSEKSYLKKIDRSVFELTGNKQTNRLTQNDISRQMYRLRAAKIKFAISCALKDIYEKPAIYSVRFYRYCATPSCHTVMKQVQSTTRNLLFLKNLI
jgi:hypothetical protein